MSERRISLGIGYHPFSMDHSRDASGISYPRRNHKTIAGELQWRTAMESRHKRGVIGIASPQEMRERLLAAARGKSPPVTEEAKVWMSLETLTRLLTAENRKLLAILAQERPRSVSALAKRLGRDQGNVSRTVGRLVEAGFVRLVPEGREKRPEVAIERLRIELDLVRDTLAIA